MAKGVQPSQHDLFTRTIDRQPWDLKMSWLFFDMFTGISSAWDKFLHLHGLLFFLYLEACIWPSQLHRAHYFFPRNSLNCTPFSDFQKSKKEWVINVIKIVFRIFQISKWNITLVSLSRINFGLVTRGWRLSFHELGHNPKAPDGLTNLPSPLHSKLF